MKGTKIAALVLAIVMLVSVMSVGFGASAVDASSETGQSSLSNVQLNSGVISGHFSIYGWLNNITVYVGQGTSGAVVGTYANPAGDWTIDADFSINLSDGGSSTSGYSVVMTNTQGSQTVTAYIPYTGPSYLMEIRRNGSVISDLDIGINEGTASGFSFVYENGGSYTYSVSDSSVIDIVKSGDTFTIAPKKIGTATITAICNEVSSTILTVNVVDDSTLTAQWYDTGAAIANNASFSGQATVTYGFGVEAFPDNYQVSLSNNTANATYASSSVQGQYPNSIVAANEGSVKVTIAGATKSISFTVNFTAAPEPVFGFYTDSACKTEAEPMVAIEASKSAAIYANEDVASWVVEGAGAAKSASTATSITIAAATVDSLVTVRAFDADGTELGWFDVYVTGTEEEPEVPQANVFVFKIDDENIYCANDGNKFSAGAPATFSADGRTLVPVRAIAGAVGIDDLKYDAATQKINFTDRYGNAVELTIGSSEFTISNGSEVQTFGITAPVVMNYTTMLPLREVSALVGGSVKYVVDNGYSYIVASAEPFDEAAVPSYIAGYEAK